MLHIIDITIEDTKVYSLPERYMNNSGILHLSNGEIFEHSNIHTDFLQDFSYWAAERSYRVYGCDYENFYIKVARVYRRGILKLADCIKFIRKRRCEPAFFDTFVPCIDPATGYLDSAFSYRPLVSIYDLILEGERGNYREIYRRRGNVISIDLSGGEYDSYWRYNFEVTDLDKFVVLVTKLNMRYC